MDFSDALLIVGTKTMVTLLPLVPAYVLFKTLRSHAQVEGPMAGLKIQLGGAFGAYFIVFVVLWQGLGTEVEEFHYHNWTVAGRVEFETDGERPNPHDITTYVKPPLLLVDADGAFEFSVPVREFSNGKIEWPTITMEMGGFQHGVVRLSPKKEGWGAEVIPLKHDPGRVINLQEPVRLKAQTYSPVSSEAPVLSVSNH